MWLSQKSEPVVPLHVRWTGQHAPLWYVQGYPTSVTSSPILSLKGVPMIRNQLANRFPIFAYVLGVSVALLMLTACTEGATSEPTTEPTWTPEPTWTSEPQVATLAPDETQTSASTKSPAVTPTATPTELPTATPTPRPTLTPIPTLTNLELSRLALLNVHCAAEWFQEGIIDLSQNNQSLFAPEILKIYDDSEESERAEDLLVCEATAKLSVGGDAILTYHYEIDRDGEPFIGYQIGEFLPTPTPLPTSTPVGTPTPTPLPPLGSTDRPVPLGQVVEVWGNGQPAWELSVSEVNPDAWNVIMTENSWNEPPASGNQFFMIGLRAKYVGSGSATLGYDIRLRVVGESAVVYDDTGCSYVIPNALDSYAEVFTGGQLEGNVCWEILTSDADSLFLFVDVGYGGERIWFYLR